jgi:lysozyme
MVDRTLMLAQLTPEEGFRATPYLDTKGKLTFAIGYNITDRGLAFFESVVGYKLDPLAPVCTLPEAQQVCLADVDRMEHAVTVYWPQFTALVEPRQRAVVDLAFNMGLGLLTFRLAIAAASENPPDWSGCAMQLYKSDWRVEVGPTRSNRVIQQILTGRDVVPFAA